MTGANIEFHEGKSYLAKLKALKVAGLEDEIKWRRIAEPQAGVEVAVGVFVDALTVAGQDLKYLFLKDRNHVFLVDVKKGAFSEPEIGAVAALAAMRLKKR
jgi:hypothetical protein